MVSRVLAKRAIAWCLAAIVFLSSCTEEDEHVKAAKSPDNPVPAFTTGQEWAYSDAPRMFGGTLRIAGSSGDTPCGLVYLVQVRDLHRSSHSLQVWVSGAALQRSVTELKGTGADIVRDLSPGSGDMSEFRKPCPMLEGTVSEVLLLHESMRSHTQWVEKEEG